MHSASFDVTYMAAKANLDLVEQLLTRIIDKFTESIATMMLEFTKTINDTFSVRISSLETKLLSIESKLSQPNPQIMTLMYPRLQLPL